MLTIKYIYPDGTESITTDWEFISAEMVDAKGERIDHGSRDYDESVAQTPSPNKPRYLVVHAHNERQDRRMTFGPNIPSDEARPLEPARVFVMNDAGATVASYFL